MPSLLLASCVGLALIAELPVVSIAQENREAHARAYDSLALRVETHMGEFRIIRGLNGPEVGHIGMFTRVNLEPLVASSENAAREAREFNRHHGPGMLAGVTGLVIFGVAAAASSVADTNWGLTAATVGGGALMIYGAVRLDKAYSSLSKAIWWYNRDLKE